MKLMKARKPGSFHQALAAGVDEAGGAEMVAAFAQVTKFTVLHWTDPDDRKHGLKLKTFIQICDRFRLQAIARYFADLAGGLFIPPVPAGLDPRWSELTAVAAEDMGRFTAEIVRDLADQKLDRLEASRCLTLLMEKMRHDAELAGWLRAVMEGRQ